MSGYGGTDDEALHAIILCENGVAAAQSMLKGKVLERCLDCDEQIAPARLALAIKLGHKCEYCITCQPQHDTIPKVRMLDHIL